MKAPRIRKGDRRRWPISRDVIEFTGRVPSGMYRGQWYITHVTGEHIGQEGIISRKDALEWTEEMDQS